MLNFFWGDFRGFSFFSYNFSWRWKKVRKLVFLTHRLKQSCESSYLKSMAAPRFGILLHTNTEAWCAVAVQKWPLFCWPSNTDPYRSFWISQCQGAAHISCQNLHRTEDMWVFLCQASFQKSQFFSNKSHTFSLKFEDVWIMKILNLMCCLHLSTHIIHKNLA